MEYNRRVGKVYVRTPILTVNGSDVGFDGNHIGLSGFNQIESDNQFNNPSVGDRNVASIKINVGDGIKIRMHESTGNILVKRLCNMPVYLRQCAQQQQEEEKVGQNPHHRSVSSKSKLLPKRTSVLLFNMAWFKAALSREMKYCSSSSVSRQHSILLQLLLQQHCFAFLSFGKLSFPSTITSSSSSSCGSGSMNSDQQLLLNTPLWIIVINLVALEMLLKMLPPSLQVFTPTRIMIQGENFVVPET